jgi:hypothetical protein
MSHVDEGTLHAYLDGALEEYPALEARRVRDHLDACATCRERLMAERGIRDEAASILALATPHVEAPTLEELRAYARAAATRRPLVGRRMQWLGWAASLVLALGAGWMLRGGEGGTTAEPVGPMGPLGPMGPATRQEAAAPGRERLGVTPTVEIARAAAPAAEDVQVPRPGMPEIVAIAIDTPSADVTVDEAVIETIGPVDLAPPALPEPETIIVASLDPRTLEPEVPTNPEDARDAAPAERRSTPGEIVTSASVAAPTVGLASARNASETRDAATSEDDTYSLVVPGLAVLDVRFRGSGTRPEGQVALQRLESGDTLEVIHLPTDLDPASLEERSPGTNELVVRRSAGWIVMRAPLADARLIELMTQLLSAGR